MQPKKFSEYTPITETDGTEVIPILKAGVNATVKSEDLPISTATQTAIDASDADIAAHVADVANPHQVTKSQVGLGNADNTSDVNKPVSTAQATAIALKADQSTTYTKTEVDTKDTAVADTAQTNLTAHTSNTSNPHATTKAQVGLANADNTSDVDKPISAATQTALDAKATNTALDAHTTNTSNPHSVTKAQVGLGNVDNTSDVNKPISTATQTALNAKANASGTVNLTGDQTIAGVKTFTSAPIAPSGTSIGGVLYLTGTGFPNGVVSAPVGSKYIDTANTNGAIEWMKASGTGNTGWVVSVGNTGRRNIIGLLSPEWEGSLAPRATLERANQVVTLTLRIKATATLASAARNRANFLVRIIETLPVGFSPPYYMTLGTATVAPSGAGICLGGINNGATGVDISIQGVGATGNWALNDSLHCNISWTTTNAWPTTLPGTPTA